MVFARSVGSLAALGAVSALAITDATCDPSRFRLPCPLAPCALPPLAPSWHHPLTGTSQYVPRPTVIVRYVLLEVPSICMIDFFPYVPACMIASFWTLATTKMHGVKTQYGTRAHHGLVTSNFHSLCETRLT